MTGHSATTTRCFNTQPPEGGCEVALGDLPEVYVFQHTAARRRLPQRNHTADTGAWVSTHSRPKAAASSAAPIIFCRLKFQHTDARRRLPGLHLVLLTLNLFQHTAARRRLRAMRAMKNEAKEVSTHSRPKAAAHDVMRYGRRVQVSTHSRPKAAAASRPPAPMR